MGIYNNNEQTPDGLHQLTAYRKKKQNQSLKSFDFFPPPSELVSSQPRSRDSAKKLLFFFLLAASHMAQIHIRFHFDFGTADTLVPGDGLSAHIDLRFFSSREFQNARKNTETEN